MNDEGRRRHYGAFYGLEELPEGSRPRVYVHGNCQAEALRVAISTADVVDSVRVPPVHELTEEDLPHLDRLLAWADVLAAQQVARGYRGLPLGTDEVGARMGAARRVALPNYFSTVLYPEQVLVRHEDPGVEDPPVVPYHDVRRLGLAAGWCPPGRYAAGGGAADHAGVVVAGIRENAALSLAELERREGEQRSLVISDVVRAAAADAGWTVDHPGNVVLLALAQRVVDAIVGEPGVGGEGDAGADGQARRATVSDPGRVLLGSVRTPLRADVLSALRLDGEPLDTWLVDGREVSDEEIGAAHLAFYVDHPRVLEVGIARTGDLLRRLGWTP